MDADKGCENRIRELKLRWARVFRVYRHSPTFLGVRAFPVSFIGLRCNAFPIHPSANQSGRKSKALLDLETDIKTSIESKLLFCKKEDVFKSQTAKQESSMPDKKPDIFAVPESQVLGKIKDFLGGISEANKRLQSDAKDNSHKYNIEALTGNESEYIEMDLMLGVADLHTPEAVAAAESAICGSQPVISLAASSTDDDEDDDESDDDENKSEATGANSSSETKRKNHSKKRPKIIELS